MQTPDASVDAAPADAPALGCLIPNDYGALGAKTGAANTTAANSLTVTLDAGPPRDALFIRLVAGKGVFAGGLTTGTFPLAGADTNLGTCGLCTSITADITAGVGPKQLYMAQTGSVTITSTNPVAGSAQNVDLIEIDFAGAPVTGGCNSKIASVAFSAQ